MRITFTPQRRDGELTVSKQGDVLVINGEEFDFSPLQDGDLLPAEAVECAFIAGSVERIGGEIRVSLVLPHGANPPLHVAFPVPLIDPADGVIEVQA